VPAKRVPSGLWKSGISASLALLATHDPDQARFHRIITNT
jgi:hypothetical protein